MEFMVYYVAQEIVSPKYLTKLNAGYVQVYGTVIDNIWHWLVILKGPKYQDITIPTSWT